MGAVVGAGKLIRLYEADAAGLLDDELLDDVGWRIWERLQDVLLVTAGKVRCPSCSTQFVVRTRERATDDLVSCPGGCGWSVTPGDWHKSWEHRDLNGRCAEFERFVAAWPAARSTSDRMLVIDTVVHALHESSRPDAPGNFAARNFLEGSRPKIVALLDELAEGPGSNVAAAARERYEVARQHYRSADRAGGDSC